jgi:formate dehydrogenase iron-sulfur subunit
MAEAMGFYTDTTVCIGCKACQVACKEWNQLPAINGGKNVLSGNSYDNTVQLDGINWLMMSDVCKHCVQAGCLEVCPTGAIMRTEFDTVVIQQDVCNGCRYCIAACPFDVIGINDATHTAQKCTLCYDRLKVGMVPACAQACPTQSIQFGTITDLKQRAAARVDALHRVGRNDAYLYGADDRFLGGLNSFYLLEDKPEVYGLPSNPKLPISTKLAPSSLLSIGGAAVLGLIGFLSFRKRRMEAPVAAEVPVEEVR